MCAVNAVHAFVPSSGMRRALAVERLAPLSATTADFKNGLNLDIDNVPWKIQEFLHVKPGKVCWLVGSSHPKKRAAAYFLTDIIDVFRASCIPY